MFSYELNDFADAFASQMFEAADSFFNQIFPKRRISSVLLVNPPEADEELFRYETAKRGRYTNYPPYGLAIIASALRETGITVHICNLNHTVLYDCRKSNSKEQFNFSNSWCNRLKKDLQLYEPDLVGVTCMFSMTHSIFKKVCEKVKSIGYPVIAGGVHVSNDTNRILDDVPSIDIVIAKEADIAFPNLISVINKQTEISKIRQTTLNTPFHRLKFPMEIRPNNEHISRLPAFDLLSIESYSQQGVIGAFYCFKPEETIFATSLSNRGCRGKCTFCSVGKFNGKGIRQRTVKSVVDELEILNKKYGVGHIMWLDDDLFYNKKRTIQLFNEMVNRRLTLTWDATNGVVAASCTDEIISAAAESGCIAVNIGVETGNPEVLKKINKPATIKTFLNAAEVLRKYPQIHTSVFLMIGFPGETLAMIMDTVNLAKRMNMDWYRISQLHPLPNTPIYDAMVAQGLMQPVGNTELRFNGGAYGKQTEIEQGVRMVNSSFNKVFSNIDLEDIPTAEQLTDIWFYMNYHLNFHRIFCEDREIKIKQLQAHLNCLADVISPENAFALYFLGYLQFRQEGKIDPEMFNRLQKRIESSSYWSDRLKAFGLSATDFLQYNFPN